MQNTKIKRNKVNLIGRLTANPEFKETNNNKKYAVISVATSYTNWNKEKLSSFNRITIWNEDLMEKLKKYQKGSAVNLVGRMTNKKKEGENGKTITSTSLMAFDIESPEKGYKDKNIVELSGRLVFKPKLEESKNHKQYAKVTIAVSNKKDKEDSAQSDFYDFILWNEHAIKAETLEKGTLVEILATVSDGSYVNKNNEKVYTTELKPFLINEKKWTEDNKADNSNTVDNSNTAAKASKEENEESEEGFDFGFGCSNLSDFIGDSVTESSF